MAVDCRSRACSPLQLRASSLGDKSDLHHQLHGHVRTNMPMAFHSHRVWPQKTVSTRLAFGLPSTGAEKNSVLYAGGTAENDNKG